MLAAILILGFANFMLSMVSKQIIKFRYMILFILCCGSIWEFITPLYKPNCITDYYDFIAYIVGTIVYYFIVKLENNKTNLS